MALGFRPAAGVGRLAQLMLDSLKHQPCSAPAAGRNDTSVVLWFPVDGHDFDVFISHASDDKDAVARPLAAALQRIGYTVWFDEDQLVVGDSLETSIGGALAHSRFGVVILSPSFFSKVWPKRELEGLAARETLEDRKVMLPVWHDISFQEIAAHSPILANKIGVKTSLGIPRIASELDRALRRSIGAPPGTRSVLRGATYDVNILFTDATDGDWDAARHVISELGPALSERISESWAEIDIWAELPLGRGDFVRLDVAAEVLEKDLRALEDALDSPPEWLSTATLDDGRLVHILDEASQSVHFQDALNRLRDAEVLQAAGFLPGGW